MGREVTGTPVLFRGKGRRHSKILQPQDDQGDPTPCDKTSALRDRRKTPQEVRTPRDRRPQGVPPAGTTPTSENFFSVGAAVNTNPIPAGKKDSCRSRTSSSRR